MAQSHPVTIPLGKAKATLSEKLAWLYDFAKRHGPLPKRTHWRFKRTGAWFKWICSHEGVTSVFQGINNDPDLRRQWDELFYQPEGMKAAV